MGTLRIRYCCLLPAAVMARHAASPSALTSSGEGALRTPVPSDVYMSSALPALGKHSTRSLRRQRQRSAGRSTASALPRNVPREPEVLMALQSYPHLGLSHAVLLSPIPGNHLLKVSASGGGYCAVRFVAAGGGGTAVAAAATGSCVPPLLK